MSCRPGEQEIYYSYAVEPPECLGVSLINSLLKGLMSRMSAVHHGTNYAGHPGNNVQT